MRKVCFMDLTSPTCNRTPSNEIKRKRPRLWPLHQPLSPAYIPPHPLKNPLETLMYYYGASYLARIKSSLCVCSHALKRMPLCFISNQTPILFTLTASLMQHPYFAPSLPYLLYSFPPSTCCHHTTNTNSPTYCIVKENKNLVSLGKHSKVLKSS